MTVDSEPARPAYSPASDEVAKTALAEVQFLCEQRLNIVRSPDFTAEVLSSFEPRIAACLDALLTRGPHVIEWLLQSLSTAESPGEICGIAVALLESRDPQAADGILAALDKAQEEPKRRGLHMALRRGPIDLIVQPLQKWFVSGTVRQAASAAEVLAFHRRLEQNSQRLQQLCNDADPLVRRAAWCAVALVGGTSVERP